MRVCHVESAVFDDPNQVSCGGLAPVVALAQRCGLAALVSAQLSLPSKGGANAPLKVSALVAGMVTGADWITDMDLLRHGGIPRLFAGSGRRRRWGRSCARSPSAPMTWRWRPSHSHYFRSQTCRLSS